MTKTYQIAVVPGDGTGPEVVAEGLKVLNAVSRRGGFELDYTHYPFGGEHYQVLLLLVDKCFDNVPFPDYTNKFVAIKYGYGVDIFFSHDGCYFIDWRLLIYGHNIFGIDIFYGDTGNFLHLLFHFLWAFQVDYRIKNVDNCGDMNFFLLIDQVVFRYHSKQLPGRVDHWYSIDIMGCK